MTDFNDRRPGAGPKDLASLGMAASAYRQLRESQDARDAGNPRAQRSVDAAFEQLADMHRNPETGEVDTASLKNTLDYFKAHYAKGKRA